MIDISKCRTVTDLSFLFVMTRHLTSGHRDFVWMNCHTAQAHTDRQIHRATYRQTHTRRYTDTYRHTKLPNVHHSTYGSRAFYHSRQTNSLEFTAR